MRPPLRQLRCPQPPRIGCPEQVQIGVLAANAHWMGIHETFTTKRPLGWFLPSELSEQNSLVELEVSAPTPGPRDVLVEVRAVSMNPVDAKVRAHGTIG